MIEVYGYLGQPPPHVRRACSEADLVVGSARALAVLGVPEQRRLVMGPVEAVIERLVEREATTRVHAENVRGRTSRRSGDRLTFQRGRSGRSTRPWDERLPAGSESSETAAFEVRGRFERHRFGIRAEHRKSGGGVVHDRVVLLASGDPLFYGIVRRLRRAGLRCVVFPGVSSVAAAFGAVGVPWDDAQVVSAHGLPLRPALAACRALPKVAVLTGPGQGIRELAAGLADLDRWYVLAERLGETDQRIRILDGEEARQLEDILEPHVVLVLDTEPALPGTIGVACPFAGGLRPMSDLVDGGTQGLSPTANLIVGRHLPVMGQMIWTQGRIGAEVAVACARTGAAVIDFQGPPPAHVPEADLVVLDDPDRLADLRGRRPRIIVLVCDDEDAERAAAAVDDLGIPGPVAVEHLAVTDDGGSTTSAYLTTVYVEQEPTRSSGEQA